MTDSGLVLAVGCATEKDAARRARRLSVLAAELVVRGVEPWSPPERPTPIELPLADGVAIAAVRRLAAHLWAESKLPAPFRACLPEDALEDPLVAEYYASYEDEGLGRFWSGVRADRDEPDFEHLMLHRDDGGVYVPVAFENPIELEDGELVGSSAELLAECEAIARALELDPLTRPDDAGVQRALQGLDGAVPDGARWTRYGLEVHTLLSFCAAARASLAARAALELVQLG